MVVPPRAIHTFKNASDTEEAEFFMTATPSRLSGPQVVSRRLVLTPSS